MGKMIAVILLAFAGAAHARDWTASEKAWAAAWLATRAADWSQTRYIARHPEQFRETNQFLPDHPSLGEVNRHFIVSTALMFAAAHYLPQYRTRLLQVYVVVGAGYVVHNIGIGVRFQF